MADTTVTKAIPSPATTMSRGVLAPLNVHTRGSFVRAAVKEQANTTRIIDLIMPFFPLSCQVIAGFLDGDDLYWKINYHWDLLVTKLEEFVARDNVSETGLQGANSVLKNLWTIPPNPPRGYMKDKHPSDTKDASSKDRIIERHDVLALAKKEARLLFIWDKVIDANLEKDPPKAQKIWWLAVAPVANPKYGKHRTGYALDIAGSNGETTRIAKLLGASLVFNEASHVHCEFNKL